MTGKLQSEGQKMQFFYTLAADTGEMLLGSRLEFDFPKLCEEALEAILAAGGSPTLYEVYRWLHDEHGFENIQGQRFYNISLHSAERNG